MRLLDEIIVTNASLRTAVLLDAQGNVLDCAGDQATDADVVAAAVTMARPQLQAALDDLGLGRLEGFVLGTAASTLHVRACANATVVLVGVENRNAEVLQRKLEPALTAVAASIAEVPR